LLFASNNKPLTSPITFYNLNIQMKTVIVVVFAFFTITITVNAQITVDTSKSVLEIKTGGATRLLNGKGFSQAGKAASIQTLVKDDVALLNLRTSETIGATEFAGVFFNNIPNLKQGVTIWRYKPWNSWTKPVAVKDATEMEIWDVQFFYWQYADGMYGAAVPLSGNGFRTTLGSTGKQWGSKAVSYTENPHAKEVPAMAIAFGKDPFELFSRIWKTSLEAMGKSHNLVTKKKLPKPLEYIGWCTWNSSDKGKNLNEKHIIEGVKTFIDNKFPLGWVLVDDGWFQHQDSQLQSLLPDPKKFPDGFSPLIKKLKSEYGIKYTGVWHAFNGYWNGIDPESKLGQEYKDRLYSWKQTGNDGANKTYHFIKPEGNNLYDFYSAQQGYLKKEGFDFVKVDNQLVVERMAVGNYPIFSLSEKMHEALFKSADKYFGGAVVNCMDMTAEAYINFGSSAVARAVEDYFPYEEGETYDLQKGNAAAHVLQAVYNSLYFSQMVYPDFDMFQSHNPNGIFHALARTLNNGPIYLTDKPGEQNFDILNKIVFSDGKSVRSETPLLPTEDCLFQLQSPRLFKAYSKVRNTGLLVFYNAADADKVSGSYKAADVHGLTGDKFALYNYFSGKLLIANRNETFELELPRLGYGLQYVVPVEKGFAAFGLTNKYNAPATIVSQRWKANNVVITLYEGGEFKAYSAERPGKILVNGKPSSFTYTDNIITVHIPVSLKQPSIQIER
jgi:hypothetical protein